MELIITRIKDVDILIKKYKNQFELWNNFCLNSYNNYLHNKNLESFISNHKFKTYDEYLNFYHNNINKNSIIVTHYNDYFNEINETIIEENNLTLNEILYKWYNIFINIINTTDYKKFLDGINIVEDKNKLNIIIYTASNQYSFI